MLVARNVRLFTFSNFSWLAFGFGPPIRSLGKPLVFRERVFTNWSWGESPRRSSFFVI